MVRRTVLRWIGKEGNTSRVIETDGLCVCTSCRQYGVEWVWELGNETASFFVFTNQGRVFGNRGLPNIGWSSGSFWWDNHEVITSFGTLWALGIPLSSSIFSLSSFISTFLHPSLFPPYFLSHSLSPLPSPYISPSLSLSAFLSYFTLTSVLDYWGLPTEGSFWLEEVQAVCSSCSGWERMRVREWKWEWGKMGKRDREWLGSIHSLSQGKAQLSSGEHIQEI